MQTFADRGVAVAQPFRLSEGFPLVAVQDLTDPFRDERVATPESPMSPSTQFSEINPLPSIYQWNFGVQRQLPGSVIVEAGYVGSRGVKLPMTFQLNQLPDEHLALGSRLLEQEPNPFAGLVAVGALVV